MFFFYTFKKRFEIILLYDLFSAKAINITLFTVVIVQLTG